MNSRRKSSKYVKLILSDCKVWLRPLRSMKDFKRYRLLEYRSRIYVVVKIKRTVPDIKSVWVQRGVKNEEQS